MRPADRLHSRPRGSGHGVGRLRAALRHEPHARREELSLRRAQQLPADIGPGQYTCGRALDAAALDKLLAQAKTAGASVIRTWFFQSYYNGAGSTYGPFDRVLTRAAARGLKVVPVLVNHYPDCEPSGGQRKDEGFYDYGYKQVGWGYSRSFKDYARAVATKYRANSTIAFWQVANEAETSWNGGCATAIEANGHERSANILRRFADDMGATIKAADPNHLVSLGTIGTGQCGAAGAEYAVRPWVARRRHVRVPRLRPRDAAAARRRMERVRRARGAVQRARQADADRRVGRRGRRRPVRRIQWVDHVGDAASSRGLRLREAQRRLRQRRRRLPAVGEDLGRLELRPTTSTTGATGSARPTRSTR